MPSDDFEQIVSQHYEPLYRFAFSLARTEADACDLTQQTFYIWATKGHRLRDRSKVKSWLFTILHREFLNIRRRAVAGGAQPSVSELASVESGCKPSCLSFSRKVNRDNPNQRAAFA